MYYPQQRSLTPMAKERVPYMAERRPIQHDYYMDHLAYSL